MRTPPMSRKPPNVLKKTSGKVVTPFAARLRHYVRDGRERPLDRFLTARRAPADHRHGSLRGHAMGGEALGDFADSLHTHQDHLRAGNFRDLLKLQARGGLGWILMP